MPVTSEDQRIYDRAGIEDSLIEYLESHSDGAVNPVDNLGEVLARSDLRASAGPKAPGLELAHYISETFGIPVTDLRAYNPKNLSVDQAVTETFSLHTRYNKASGGETRGGMNSNGKRKSL